MKKLLLSSTLLVGLAAGAFAQGFISLDNIQNTGTSPSATTNGLFFLGNALTHGDLNAAFYGGTDSANLSLIASFSGAAAAGTGAFGDGTFLDPTGNSYAIPGSTSTAFFRIEAWMGTATSFANATIKGQSSVFANPVAVSPNTPPDFVNMPAVIIAVPEPSTFALAGLGAAALLIFRRRK